ncbi:centromere protein W isoform a [Daubentonia madagascariensis]|uniref:Centromere protein W isoform a n=2 Tax=Daubentonia madagascariensis TaxID=31869 RepID=A0ABD2F2L0_DAUMA
MALSTTVSHRKQIKRTAPRGFLKRVFKRQKPHLRLEKSADLLVRFPPFSGWEWGTGVILKKSRG